MNKIKCLFIFVLLSISSLLLSENLTFFVASDPHYGYDMFENNEKINKSAIDDMNALPGTKYPDIIGGSVKTPKGVLIPEDLRLVGTDIGIYHGQMVSMMIMKLAVMDVYAIRFMKDLEITTSIILRTKRSLYSKA